MRTRFDRDERGNLVDRHGYVLTLADFLRHDVVSVTLEHLGDIRGCTEVEELPELSPPTDIRDGESEGKGDDAADVWAAYVEAMEPRDKALHPAERKLINEALRVATKDECVRAVWGCRSSAFHMGDNNKHRKYNRLSHILKGKRGLRTLREQIDFFIDLAEKNRVGDTSGRSNVTVDPSKLERSRRAVYRAWEMPHSEHAQEQAADAERWLNEHGWRVVRSGNDRPKIEREDT